MLISEGTDNSGDQASTEAVDEEETKWLCMRDRNQRPGRSGLRCYCGSNPSTGCESVWFPVDGASFFIFLEQLGRSEGEVEDEG